MSEIEFFDGSTEDWWICICGNTPIGSGYALARTDGTHDDHDPQWSTHQTLTCLDCRRYGRQTERDIMTGQVPVRGRAPLCIICGDITDQTVLGRVADNTGVVCADCQHWCDGNIVMSE